MTDKALATRPMPPASILELDPYGWFEPAHDVERWIHQVLIDQEGQIHNPDHIHLVDARIGILWSTAPCSMKGREVIGMAEIPSFRCNKWQKGRQEQQLRGWFGEIPDFLVTLDAWHCHNATDAEFLALVEHELYHCGQAMDEFGEPRFNQDTGAPIFTIRGHDVEEFVGVVRRYGVIGQDMEDLMIAAANRPEIAKVDVARACGTCKLKSA